MEDETRHRFQAQAIEGPSEQAEGRIPRGTSPQSSVQSSRTNMEFAPLPLHHFGPPGGGHAAYDMRPMANALPDYAYMGYPQSQQQTHMSSMGGAPSVPLPAQHFAGQIAGNVNYPFSAQQFGQPTSQQSSYSNYAQSHPAQRQPHNQSYMQNQHINQSSPPTRQMHYSHYAQQYGPGLSTMSTSSNQIRPGSGYNVPRLQVDAQTSGLSISYPTESRIRRNSSSSSLQASSALRGPPRKPKQSGHALWVGNLPPGTHIIDLKDHFSRDATEDIESVFFISKSNCAFVNYKTEESCSAAMTRFHDSRFRGVRLVCRLRRGSSPSSATTPNAGPNSTRLPNSTEMESSAQEMAAGSGKDAKPEEQIPVEKSVKEKYFVVKSLTIDDLERSVQTGIWATQAHNEDILNEAFKSTEDVYLIFSANKSGEYFGFARMDSSIDLTAEPTMAESKNPDSTTSIAVQSAGHGDVPVTIPTPATLTAPRGRIIDDSARGTIFWEADSVSLITPTSAEGTVQDSGETSGEEVGQRGGTQQATYGRPFKIVWQSTERLPFYRTRGLRNPWNANREVKIARDGTEIEPTIGRKLISMFQQQAQINAANRQAAQGAAQYGYQAQGMPFPGAGGVGHPNYGYAQAPGSYGRPY